MINKNPCNFSIRNSQFTSNYAKHSNSMYVRYICRYLLHAFPCSSRAVPNRNIMQIETNLKCKMSLLILDQYFTFFPMVHLLLLVVGYHVLTGNWRKHFTETVLAFNLHFQHIGLNLQENKVHHSKEREILV
jgi:hypothetical protein